MACLRVFCREVKGKREGGREGGRRKGRRPNKCSPGLTPPFLHTASDQKLDGEKASPLSLLGRSENKARK